MKDNAPHRTPPRSRHHPDGPPEAVGFEASWERFRAEALGLNPRDVKTSPYNASVVLPRRPGGSERRRWPTAVVRASARRAARVDFARVANTTAAAEALVFVASQAAGVARATPVVRAKIVRARVVVRALEAGATALVEVGVLQAEVSPARRRPQPLRPRRATASPTRHSSGRSTRGRAALLA